jgi:hypothetical protein
VDGIGVLGIALGMLDVLSVGVTATMRALEVMGLLCSYGCQASAVQDGKDPVVPPPSGPVSSRRTDPAERVHPGSRNPEYDDDFAHDLCFASGDRCVGRGMRHQPIVAG